MEWHWWFHIEYHASCASFHWRPSYKPSLQIHHLCCQWLQIQWLFHWNLVTAVHPFFLKAKFEASKEDNPNCHQAMNGLFADEYCKAAKKEVTTLEGMCTWDVVWHEYDMNVINGIWAFQCKSLPNVIVKKFKTHFCSCGDPQLEGIDFIETNAPVVQWATVCPMLVLENLLSRESKQADKSTAFLHVTLGEMRKYM